MSVPPDKAAPDTGTARFYRSGGGGLSSAAVGLGLRREHASARLNGRAEVGFLEVHAENYMAAGGGARDLLDRLAERYPISLHGVALSLGGVEPPDRAHLAALKVLADSIAPALISEHLAWSSHEGVYFNDLLPIAYTQTALARVSDHIHAVQDVLGRAILLENPSRYYHLAGEDLEETDFLHALVKRTGCGLLLDVNNVFVSAQNLGFSAERYLRNFPVEHVGEIHLAGHEAVELERGGHKLLDSHGAPIADPVWKLYADLLERIGPRPTLIERDNDVPPLDALLAELGRARRLMTLVGVDHV